MEKINKFFNIAGFNGTSALITKEELWKPYPKEMLLNKDLS